MEYFELGNLDSMRDWGHARWLFSIFKNTQRNYTAQPKPELWRALLSNRTPEEMYFTLLYYAGIMSRGCGWCCSRTSRTTSCWPPGTCTPSGTTPIQNLSNYKAETLRLYYFCGQWTILFFLYRNFSKHLATLLSASTSSCTQFSLCLSALKSLLSKLMPGWLDVSSRVTSRVWCNVWTRQGREMRSAGASQYCIYCCRHTRLHCSIVLLYREFVEEAFRYIGRELEWEGSGDTEVCWTAGTLHPTTLMLCRSGGRREAARWGWRWTPSSTGRPRWSSC